MLREPHEIEEALFEQVKNHLERLPGIGPERYANGFEDVIALYGDGGSPHSEEKGFYDPIIRAQLNNAFNALPLSQKKVLIDDYEVNYLKGYYAVQTGSYGYTDEVFLNVLFSQFIGWMADGFSGSDLDGWIRRYDRTSTQDAIALISQAIDLIAQKDISPLKRRTLELACVYLRYHPLLPDEPFRFGISFSKDNLNFEIAYSAYTISVAICYSDEGELNYLFKDEISAEGGSESVGFHDEYAHYFLTHLEQTEHENIMVGIEI